MDGNTSKYLAKGFRVKQPLPSGKEFVVEVWGEREQTQWSFSLYSGGQQIRALDGEKKAEDLECIAGAIGRMRAQFAGPGGDRDACLGIADHVGHGCPSMVDGVLHGRSDDVTQVFVEGLQLKVHRLASSVADLAGALELMGARVKDLESQMVEG